MRRAWGIVWPWMRRLLKLTAWLFGIAVLAVGALLIWLHTDSGRRYVKGKIEQGLSAELRGYVKIGKLRGSVLNGPTLSEIQIFDENGNQVIGINKISVDYSLLPLIRKQVRLGHLLIDKPWVKVRVYEDGTTNLARLVAPKEPKKDEEKEEKSGGSAWRVLIGAVTIAGGNITYKQPDEPVQRISPLEIGVHGIEIRGADIITERFTASARWLEEAIDFSIKGKAAMQGEVATVSAELSALQGERSLGVATLERAAVNLDLSQLDAVLSLNAPAETLRRLQRENQGPWPGGADISVRASRSSSERPIVVELDGTVAGAPVAVVAEITPESKRVVATLIVENLQATNMVADGQPGSVEFRVDAEATGSSLEDLRARVSVNAGARLQLPERTDTLIVRDLDARAELAMGALDFDVSVASDSHQASGSARGLIDILSDPVAVHHVVVTGFAGALRKLVPDAQLRGRGRVDAVAMGTVEEIDVSGAGRGSGIRQKEVRIPYASARFRLSGPVAKLRGNAQINAGKVRYGEEDLEAVSIGARSNDGFKTTAVTISVGTKRSTNQLRGSATIAIDPKKTRVRVGRLRGKIQGIPWDSVGGSAVTVMPDGNIRVRQLEVRSKLGSIRADGTLFGGLRVWVKRLSIAELAKTMKMPPPYPRGFVELEATARQVGTSFRGLASGTVTGFALDRDRPVIGGDFKATLGRRTLSASAKLGGKGIGAFDIEIDTRTPRDQFNPLGWERLGSRAMRSARANLTDVRVAGAMAFVGQPQLARGVISGSVELNDGARKATGEVTASGFRVVGVRQRVNASAKMSAEGGRLVIRTLARGRGLGSVHGDMEAHIPVDLADVEHWKRMNEYSVASARFDAKKLSLTRLRTLVPTMPPIRGIVEGSVQVADRARRATIIGRVIKIHNARTAKRPVDGSLRAVVDADSTTLSFESRIKGTPLANGTASLAAGIATLRSGGVEAVQKARVLVRAKLARLPLRMVADAAQLELRKRMSGALIANATVTGTVENPRIVATADLSGARVDRVKFENFDVRAEMGDKVIVANAIAKQKHGGRLDAVINIERTGKQRVNGSLTAKDFELQFLRGLDRGGASPFAGVAGRAFASVQVTGDAENIQPRGSMRIRGGKMRPADMAPIHDMNLSATFDTKQVVASLSARSGSGSLSAKVTGKMGKKALESVVARVKTRRFPYVGADQTIKIDSDTRISARPKGLMWDVNANVLSATVRIPSPTDKKNRSLHTVKALSDVVFIDDPNRRRRRRRLISTKPKLNLEPTMRIKVNAPGTIRLRGADDFIKASASANLIITLIGNDAIIQGRVRTNRGRDRVKILERYYEIDKAEIVFDGQIPPDPRLDVKISHAFDSLTLQVGIIGRASKIEPPIFTSDPGGYDRATLLGFFLGRDPDDATSTEVPLSTKAKELGASFLASKAQELFRDVLPVDFDVLNVEFKEGTTGELSRITAGKWINDDLFVAYRYSPAADEVNNTQEAQVEYRLTKRWSLESTYGNRNKGGLDILWIRRY